MFPLVILRRKGGLHDVSLVILRWKGGLHEVSLSNLKIERWIA